ncbi:MAG: alpha/beta fold hydrolase [Caulobacteraceae bacterium]
MLDAVSWRTLYAIILAVAALAGSPTTTKAQTANAPAVNAPADFYAFGPGDLAGRPGTLIRSEIVERGPISARAYRVLYRSVGLDGRMTAVSGMVMIPVAPPPPGGRPIVAWAHPTTGVQPQCGPSMARLFFPSVQGLRNMLRRGYIVTATDYPGLGTAGPHPYLVGVSEGRAVLDSVRAAAALPGASAGHSFAVWGHSQGGQAALFTGLLAQGYAPEWRLAGVAAAAPATDLSLLMKDDIDTNGGRNLTAMTVWSWSRVYGAPLSNVVLPKAMPVVDHLASLCIERWFDMFSRRGPTRKLRRRFLSGSDFADTQPWRMLLAQNTPGALPKQVPVFLAQGSADRLVRPEVTAAYAEALCRNGGAVQYDLVPGVGHAFIARDAAPAAIAWIAARFAGARPASTCR